MAHADDGCVAHTETHKLRLACHQSAQKWRRGPAICVCVCVCPNVMFLLHRWYAELGAINIRQINVTLHGAAGWWTNAGLAFFRVVCCHHGEAQPINIKWHGFSVKARQMSAHSRQLLNVQLRNAGNRTLEPSRRVWACLVPVWCRPPCHDFRPNRISASGNDWKMLRAL